MFLIRIWFIKKDSITSCLIMTHLKLYSSFISYDVLCILDKKITDNTLDLLTIRATQIEKYISVRLEAFRLN